MKYLLVLLICVPLLGCGILTVQPTVTATNTATQTQTLTPQPNLTATQRVVMASTQTMRASNARATLTKQAEPTVTALAQSANALAEITAVAGGVVDFDLSKAKLVFGPMSDRLVQKEDGYVEAINPEISVRNFIVSITFINPYDTATTGNWDYGIFFRNKYKNDQYRLVILSDQTWTLIDSKTNRYVDTNASQSLTRKSGEKNTIWLIVIDETAYLFINGTYEKALNVSRVSSGDISPATGIYYGNAKGQKATEFQDFRVWSLP